MSNIRSTEPPTTSSVAALIRSQWALDAGASAGNFYLVFEGTGAVSSASWMRSAETCRRLGMCRAPESASPASER